MRKLVFKLLLIIAPVGLILAGTNYLVDPANIFATGYVEGIANALTSGHNVDNLSNYDERSLQERMIKKINQVPDVTVAGSSRVMLIGRDFFPGKKVLNCAVSHGNINDVLAVVGLWDSLKTLPHEMVIGLDHWLVCHEGTSEWQSLYPYHQYLVEKITGADEQANGIAAPNPFRKVSNLFALDYFQSGLRFILGGKSKKYVDVGTNRPGSYGRLSDGTVVYAPDYTHPNVPALAVDAKVNGAKEGIPNPDNTKIRLLEALLGYLQKKNIQVHLVMAPYHPAFYKAARETHHQTLVDVEPIFKNIAAKYHFPISGSFDADKLGMPESAFYDSYHCAGEAIKQYIPIQ